ncbi:MAG: flagellar biosynthesis anti-sigma factor FlgM [Deltaproteobacteria bacterium]|nr:flagellar biosynthesis anti-sigma factor FlgM [Deltaproteobacteria bacterium]
MSTSRIGSYTPKATDGLNPAATPQSKAEDGKVQNAKAVAPAAAPQGAGQTANNARANKDYGVNISDAAKTKAEAYQKALDIARSTPDVREDRVSDIKKQIADGTYKPDAGRIADGMLHEAIKEHLAESDN